MQHLVGAAVGQRAKGMHLLLSSPAWVAGATSAATGKVSRALPLLLPEDAVIQADRLVQQELKFARQWLYAKGISVPKESRNPVTISLDSFFDCARTGRRPAAGLEAGLNDSTAVILANLAMDEGRRVYYSEMDKLGAS